MIFTDQEARSRRQFHELFCTRYLYTGKKKGALNDDSWTADTLYDILRNVYSNNILTPQDIETILHVGGMFDADGKLFFHYREETPLIKEILYAISPFITNQAFIRCKQRLGGATSDSVAAFVVRCCTNPDQGNEKIPMKELYEYYTHWCALNRELAMSKKVFSRRLSEIGFRIKKGYVNGNSGILHVLIKLDKEAVNTDAKPQGTPQETETQLERAEPIRNVDRTGAQVLKNLIQAEEGRLPEDEGGQNITASGGGSYVEYAADGRVDKESDESDEADPDNSGDPDDFDWGATDDGDEDSEDGFDAPATTPQAGAGELVIPNSIHTKDQAEAFVKTLPYNLRTAFKQMKVTYRISPDSLELEEFESIIRSLGVTNTNVSELFHLFILYASRLGG